MNFSISKQYRSFSRSFIRSYTHWICCAFGFGEFNAVKWDFFYFFHFFFFLIEKYIFAKSRHRAKILVIHPISKQVPQNQYLWNECTEIFFFFLWPYFMLFFCSFLLDFLRSILFCFKKFITPLSENVYFFSFLLRTYFNFFFFFWRSFFSLFVYIFKNWFFACIFHNTKWKICRSNSPKSWNIFSFHNLSSLLNHPTTNPLDMGQIWETLSSWPFSFLL